VIGKEWNHQKSTTRKWIAHTGSGGHRGREVMALQTYLLNGQPVEVETQVTVDFPWQGRANMQETQESF
jgi:hypothetical protein